jgi:opacity protein-like surface antigen
MFKKLVPVVSLLLLAAGPVFAADTAAPSSDTSASAPAKTHKAKHSGHKSKKSKSSTGDSSAPKK